MSRQFQRLVGSIKAGIDPALVRDEISSLQKKREILERERAESIDSAPVAAEIVRAAIEGYGEPIANLEMVLLDATLAAREVLSEIFGGAIELVPGENGSLDAKMAGNAAGLFSLIAATPGIAAKSKINVVAGIGFEPMTFGL